MGSRIQFAFIVVIIALTACGRERGDDGSGGDDENCAESGTCVCDPTCPSDKVCSNGVCKSPCDAADDRPSNVGCDFWAADLDNESSNALGFTSDAAGQQFAVVVANNNDAPATVAVLINTARVGDPVQEMVVRNVMAAPHSATRIDLDKREVDGSMGQNGGYTPNSGSGTFVAPHAFHILSDLPVVVYQFNPIVQQFSNDASTLVPKQALGSDYIVIGYETANPCSIGGLPGLSGVPDHGAITIIPIEDGTQVTITANHAIKASSGDSGIAIPMTAKGANLTLNLDRYTTANLETEQVEGGDIGACVSAINNGQDGDFTGTYIKSNKPIAVFASNERGIGLGGATNFVNHPDWGTDDDACCTDHLEEQLFPVTSFGRVFAVGRSPVRSTHATWKEGDIVRVVGTVDNTNVTTNLPAPYDHFTVNARGDVTFAATTGFTLVADQPVQIGSYLVSQNLVVDGFIGDPSQITIPAVEQYRKDYTFLVPSTFTSNYAVFAAPSDAVITIDGGSLSEQCVRAPIGPLEIVDEQAGTSETIEFTQITCPIGEGSHEVTSESKFGLSVYGYYNVGSYAFVGGSDLKIINPIL